jgi:hypothetical protein
MHVGLNGWKPEQKAASPSLIMAVQPTQTTEQQFAYSNNPTTFSWSDGKGVKAMSYTATGIGTAISKSCTEDCGFESTITIPGSAKG